MVTRAKVRDSRVGPGRERRSERLYGVRISGVKVISGGIPTPSRYPDSGAEEEKMVEVTTERRGTVRVVYSGANLPDAETLARLNSTPGPVFAAPVWLPDPATVLEVARSGRLHIGELPTLLAADVLFVRREIVGPVKEWAVAFLIRVFTFTRKDKRPTAINHTATVVRPGYEFEEILADGTFVHSGPVVDYVISEALGEGGFQYRRLLEAYGDSRLYSIALARHRLATDRHRAKILAAGGSLVGRPYGYLKVGAHAADYGLTVLWNLAGGPGDVYAIRRLVRMERYPMCSWATVFVYRKGGLPFSSALETASPDDLWDECRRKAMLIWDWVYTSPALEAALRGPGFGDVVGGRTS
jgi:hypothetical protein